MFLVGSHFFVSCCMSPRGDDLEDRTAQALVQVHADELQRHALDLPKSRLLQQHALDLVILSCSRFICKSIFQKQGMPSELVARLRAALPATVFDDLYLWSRVAGSKHQVFHKDIKFCKRKCRHGRGGRKSKRYQVDVLVDDESESEK